MQHIPSDKVAARGFLRLPAPTCSGPKGMVLLEPSGPDSTFFRGCGAWELTLSKDVHLV